MATIKDIARRAGVSIGTVDRVIHNRGRVSPETEGLIRRLIEEMGYRPNIAAQGLAFLKKKLNFSFFIVDPSHNQFFEAVLDGAKQKADELAQYGVDVTFYTHNFFNLSFDLASFQTDGIVLLGTETDPLVARIMDWAEAHTVPVVCYNIPLTSRDCLAYVGCDYVQAGKIAAGLCALASDSKGKVAILSEDTDVKGPVLSFQRRLLGFQRELAEKYPHIEVVGIYGIQLEKAFEDVVYQMLWEHPELDTVYLVNPGDYRACQIIHDAARKPNIKIITNDLTRQQRSLVKSGLISATICQEPERQGSQPLDILFQYVVNKIPPPAKNCYTSLSICISQNV